MRSKLVIGGLTVAVAFLLATNPVVVNAAGQITSAQIKNNTIKGKDVKDKTLTGKDVKDGSLTAADLAAGTIPAAPKVPKVRWALVNHTHTAILAQSGGISITSVSGGGTYLDMGEDVAGAAISATNAYTDADGGFKGGIIATICGGAPYGGTCSGGGNVNNTNHVWVFTENTASNAGENHAFYVTVIG
ncbi:MAG TPA: hypothetical protein PLZ93_06075 [Nocardioides sp.]|uniref:hypothetical protein n=1 Tax=uncultured Nocardioides sp. TaxID=198441 RepID=UPI000EBC5A25|nr:hypothetical protein [uncultured Nocardioides sp.]HCB06629.1 hypothetical protein [Nocardioides sp.]HRD59734.1 hypothetical protein [Nocardioides sp.]HRI95158.1 hypothetical protein [Nocardioides sp.]HRK45487.1 hypothetical protein [Nocardioides sp.]